MFNKSRLITSPNPGTSVFPFGGSDVLCVVGAEATGATVDVTGDALGTVGGGGATATGASTTGGGGSTGGGGAGAGGGGAISRVDNGLAGLTGLDMFVGFVADFKQLSCVVNQSAQTASLYGVEQVDILFCVISPT